jgi:hypothetical protein
VPVDKILVRLQNVKRMDVKGQVEIGESEYEVKGNPLEMLMSDASDDEEIYNSSSSSRSEKLVS